MYGILVHRPSDPEFTKYTRDEDLVADARLSLYEVRSSSGRRHRHEGIAIARAAILVALMGGALWYLLWNAAAHLWDVC
jgi:hypothetical protein